MLNKKTVNLKSLISGLSVAKRQVKKYRGCKNPPLSEGCPICPANNSLSKVEILNLIWS